VNRSITLSLLGPDALPSASARERRVTMKQTALLASAQRGDRAALAALIDEQAGPVYALVSRMLVRQPALVDDVAQDVLLRVVENLSRFDPRGSAKLSTWVLTIATRRCIDVLRRPRRLEPLDEELAAVSPGPEESAEQRQLYRAVVAAMAELSPEQRAVLVLRAYHDFEHDQIARALEIEPGTVRSRLSRARAALRAAVDRPGGQR
jgi:RNA polymerase sigma-70 factor (ECF subfamily)